MMHSVMFIIGMALLLGAAVLKGELTPVQAPGKYQLELVIVPSPGITMSGSYMDGWSPRVYENAEMCLERKEYAEKIPFPIKGYEDNSYWSCSLVKEK